VFRDEAAGARPGARRPLRSPLAARARWPSPRESTDERDRPNLAGGGACPGEVRRGEKQEREVAPQPASDRARKVRYAAGT
jgi:hypothetical protein